MKLSKKENRKPHEQLQSREYISSLKICDLRELEETIRKVLHSELKLIFSASFPSPMQKKIESQSEDPQISKDLSPDTEEEDYLDGPIEIDFIKKNSPPTSVVTVKCKIRCLKIPAITIDFGAELPIITENIVERVGAKIDKSETHNLSGIATIPIESVGVVHNLPITLAPSFTINEDFVVVRYKKPILIFSNQLLKKYRCALDWDTNELKVPLNGKDYIIPVTMHKVKNKL